MGKKYLDTKKDSLESSVLGVWKTAIEQGEAIRDAAQMTKEVTKEEVELPDMKEALMQVRTEKHDTHVDPKDRDELDKEEPDGRGGVETAKKMKKAQEPAPGQMAEASGDKEAYKKFFNAALKKFKVSSPAELKGDDKKKFYDYIDKNWEADNEKAEAAMSQVREFKIQSMKAALAQVWGMEEGHNPFKTEVDEAKKGQVSVYDKKGKLVGLYKDMDTAKKLKPEKAGHTYKVEEDKDEVEEGLEDSPNSANKQHLCAKNVVHEEWGSGQCISTQHADPDEEGNVAWYDVMFEHGIEKGVSINELKVTKAEGHMHASHDPKKKMKKTETGKKPAEIDIKPKIKD